MSPVMLRSRLYYFKLLTIWSLAGLGVYIYHSETWTPVGTIKSSFSAKPEDKSKASVASVPSTVAAENHSPSILKPLPSSPTLPPPSSYLQRLSSWAKRDTDEGGVFENGDEAVSVIDNTNAENDDVIENMKAENDGVIDNVNVVNNDVIETINAGKDDVTNYNDNGVKYVPIHESANFNGRRMTNSDNAQANLRPDNSVPYDSAYPRQVDQNQNEILLNTKAFGFRDDVFTRDVSQLTQKEIIFRFVHNKEEFFSKSEKNLPMYLRLRNLHWTIQDAGSYPPSLYSPPPGELPEQRLPQAIIIGAGKCGTRALLEFLSMHPLAVTPDPEIHYFDFDENFANGLDWYRSQMPISYSNQMTIEKTPSYIWSSRAVEEIYRMNKSIKLIVIIRNPVDRVVSQASRGDNDDVERFFLAFENDHYRIKSESRTVDWGIYVKYLKAWMDRYPPSQLHIIETKELTRNPALEMQKVERFLGLPPMITDDNFYFNATKGFYCMRPFYPTQIKCLPEAKGKKHLQLLPFHEKLLYDYYRPFNEQLFQLIGRRFTWMPKTQLPN